MTNTATKGSHKPTPNLLASFLITVYKNVSDLIPQLLYLQNSNIQNFIMLI